MCNACDKPKYYITTAIAYASSKPHIGNVYDIIMADAIARYKRQRGYDVFLCTGTDEHGQKIELKAAEAGITPKEFVDNISGQIKAVWDGMNVSYNRFIRTTDPDHEEAIAHIFQKFYDQGDIYRTHMRAGTAHRANPSSPIPSSWTANARTAAERSFAPRKKRTTSG